MPQVKRGHRTGPLGFVLTLALIVPLGLSLALITQIPSAELGLSGTRTSSGPPLNVPRPAPAEAPPPPTLAPPTRPTATPPPPTPSAIPGPRTYTVQPGDELKQVAAHYGVSVWSIIDANNIPNPDSLRVGQVLTIPAR